jgi:hypothetical protein
VKKGFAVIIFQINRYKQFNREAKQGLPVFLPNMENLYVKT